MSKIKTLSFEERGEKGTSAARRARKVGIVPAIVYSRGKQSTPISVNNEEWKLLNKGEVHIVELNSKSGAKINALVKDVQYNYLKEQTVHIDFQEVRMDEVITSHVTVHTKGIASGIAQGGILEHIMHEIEISCLPADIPENLEVDVSALEIDGKIKAGDIKLPENVKLATPADAIVVHVLRPKLEEEKPAEAAVGEAAVAEPELIGKKKEEEVPAEGEAAGEGKKAEGKKEEKPAKKEGK